MKIKKIKIKKWLKKDDTHLFALLQRMRHIEGRPNNLMEGSMWEDRASSLVDTSLLKKKKYTAWLHEKANVFVKEMLLH